MRVLYFTALNPASDLDIKLKKISIGFNLYSPLPPIIPIGSYNGIITQKQLNYNIHTVAEFKTRGISVDGRWLVEDIDTEALLDMTHKPYNLLGLSKPALIIGEKPDNIIDPENYKTSIIRNWSLGFYELILYNDNDYNNIELIEHWRIRKKRYN